MMKSLSVSVASLVLGAMAVSAIVPPIPMSPIDVGKLVNDKILNKMVVNIGDSLAKSKAAVASSQTQLDSSSSMIDLANLQIEDQSATASKAIYQESLAQANARGVNVEACTQSTAALDAKAQTLRDSVTQCFEMKKQQSADLAEAIEQMNADLEAKVTGLQEQINGCDSMVGSAGPGFGGLVGMPCAQQVKMAIIMQKIQFSKMDKALKNATLELDNSVKTLPDCVDIAAIQGLGVEAQTVGTTVNNCITEQLKTQEVAEA